MGFARSPINWRGQPRLFRGSCGAMLPPVAAASSIGQRLRNGMRIALLVAQSRRNWRSTLRYEAMFRTGWLVWSRLPVELRSTDPWYRGRNVGMDRGSIGDGLERGA